MLKGKNGFSLVEVVIALFIFAFAAIGITKSLIFSLETSDRVIAKSVAHNVAVGYAEQIAGLNFRRVVTPFVDEEPIELRSVSFDENLGEVTETIDIFSFGVELEKRIVMDTREDGSPQVLMPMRFRFDATAINLVPGTIDGLEIELSYSYLPTASIENGNDGWVEDSIHFVKSSIPARN